LRLDVVIPTTGRPTLWRLLATLPELPGRTIVVDDRTPGAEGFAVPQGVEVLRAHGSGPAAARNAGWRASRADWVAFLDDDVIPQRGWGEALERDLAGVGRDVAGSQGRIRVPLPAGRCSTDWERNVAGLETARWATADMAYRRSTLAAIGGFDERFPRAYREDADLGLRITGHGWRIAQGSRCVIHPVGPSGLWTSLRLQRGNADDVLMRGLHGPGWRERAGAPRGLLRLHVGLTAAGLLAAKPPRNLRSAICGLTWALGTGRLAYRRIAPGPGTPGEVARMVVTSVLMPPLATYWHLRGRTALRSRLARPAPRPEPPQAVLLDRDGTLVVDVPYNRDPHRVEPMPGARAALERLRGAGVRTAVISNQSGVGRGLVTERQLRSVNERVEELLGPLGPWLICTHGPDDGCDCRKPRPGLILRAADRLGVEPQRCAVVGDIGADMEAARAAGARGVLVPTARTRRAEVAAAPETAVDIESAIRRLLGEGR
jgi:histidinol-phosphate phosphatase family protein